MARRREAWGCSACWSEWPCAGARWRCSRAPARAPGSAYAFPSRRRRVADKIRVLIADDHTILRAGVRRLLEAEQDIAVVGEAANGEEAVALAESLRPDVVMMDVAMPGMDGLDATR